MNNLHRDAIVVDCHNDLVMTLTHPELIDGATLSKRWIPELREGGVNVQVVPVCGEGHDEGALRLSLEYIAALYRELARTPDAELCLDAESVRRVAGEGRIAMILALEGASCLGSNPEMVRVFERLGVRMISFTHFGRSPLADGSGEDATGSRLSRAGVAVLNEMEELGIIMDVSHLGIGGVEHVLELATRPVIASHSVSRQVWDHHRNLSDDQLRGLAATGGVICANAIPGYIDPQHPTLDRLVDHVEHIVEVAGVEHVGIGTDFCVEIFEDTYPTHAVLYAEGIDGRHKIEGFWAARQMPALTDALVRRGFTDGQVRGILGENLLRVFDAELGIPAGQRKGAQSPAGVA